MRYWVILSIFISFIPFANIFSIDRLNSESGELPSTRPESNPDLLQQDSSVTRQRYELQRGTPVPIRNFTHLQEECEWVSVGGQVFSTNEVPINGLVVELSGSIMGEDIYKITYTGGSLNFGGGGYEISISNQLFASEQMLRLQLKNLYGIPLSPIYEFDTYENCDKGLILMNFVEIPEVHDLFIPILSKDQTLSQ